MARVPDLGSDFAQKMLLDLRRRRERLGFGSSAVAATQQQQRAATPLDACSSSQKPLGNQRPQQAAPAPRSRSPETRTTTSRSSPGNATATAGKPRRRRDASPVAAADARAIVPFEGEGGDRKPRHVVAGDVHLQQMAALALALSDGGKLRNMEIVARNGSVFFHQPETPGHHRGGGAHASNMAIGLQDLNDMLISAYSSAGGGRRSDEAGKRFFRGSMDMEEALSMLVMLQDASGYTERSAGSGKVLLLKGKENRESASTSPARIVEIDDEESEDEQAKNASMQIVVHNKFVQSHQSPNSSPAMQSDPGDSKTNSASEGVKEGSKVRMPSVIAKLMGLENLPSSAPKTVAERKGTERFVKTESVPRMEIRTNSMDRKLPIRIVASEKVLSNGQHTILLPGEWKNNLTNFGEPELSDSSSRPAAGHKKVRLTMREVLRKMAGAEREDDGSQGVAERIIHEDKALTEEIKLQKTVSVGCRNDSGKMDFLKRFRKNSDNRPAIEDKHIAEDKSTLVRKKQATGMKRLLGRDSETKSRRAREKLNKENLATGKTKVAAPGKNGKADQMKQQAQSNKHIDRQTRTKKPQNCQETQSETPIQNLEDKKPLVQKKTEYTVMTQMEDEKHPKANDISYRKPSDSSTHGDSSFSEQLAIVVRGSSITEAASSDQSLQEITEGTSDPAILAQTVVQASDDLKFLDQSAIAEEHAEINGINSSKPSDSTHGEVGFSEPLAMVARGSSPIGESEQHLQKITETTSDLTVAARTAAVLASEDLKFMDQSAIAAINDGKINLTATETIQTPVETLAEEEQQQQHQQEVIVKEQPTDGSDHTTTAIDSTGSQEHVTHVVSCDSFTRSQLLLVRILAKDRYLLETAKGIVRVHDPVSFVDDAGADRSWSHKGNYDLLSDVAREVIRRKGKRAEAMEEVSVTCTVNMKLRCLDDLVRELNGDIESLQDIFKKPRNGAAEGLQRILRNDIQNDHPDANTTWDFSWNRVWELPIERNEVVRDLEKNILGGIITDVARDLIGVSVRHGCCPCVA
ncbi:unnamed protein product [Alopecurus aequalis]